MNQLKKIFRQISEAVDNRKDDFHTFFFSNICTGEIESRCVILRNFDDERGIIYFHSDKRSPKVNSLKDNPQSYCLFYHKDNKVQLRIKTFTKIHFSGNVWEKAWSKTKLSSRKCYLSIYNPSQTISSCDDGIPFELKGRNPSISESKKGEKNFVVVENKIKSIDWLILDSQGHKRKKFFLEDEEKNETWLAP